MTTDIRLSLCIPTLNRGRFIGETLDSILSQLAEDVEVVIVDGGSTDDTAAIVDRYVNRCDRIRYVHSALTSSTPSNEGFDRDCDQAVSLARGEYCWLMTDDDLLADNAIAEILSHLDERHDLIFCCTRVCNLDFSSTLAPALPAIDADRAYGREEWSAFVRDVGPHLTFVGGIVVRRDVWNERERAAYFGTGFVHVGVLLSSPMRSSLVIARPLVVIRYGNGLWRGRAFDIWMFHWPQLVWSFSSLPEGTLAAVTPRFPFRRIRRLLWYRALGAYSIDKYRQRLRDQPDATFRFGAWVVARLPTSFANALCSLFLASRRSRAISLQMYDLIHCGNASWLTRGLGRLRGIR